MAFKFRITLVGASLLLFALAPSTWAETSGKSTYQIPYQELKAAAQAYLAAACPPKRQRYMIKKLKDSVEQKLLDNAHLSEDSAMRSIMLDWAADNQKHIRRKESKAVFQACYFFIIFTDKGFELSWQFREALDEEACTEILKYLREETAKAKAPSTKK